MRDRDSTTVPQTQLTEKTVKLILIHASVDSLNSLNLVQSAPCRENRNRLPDRNPLQATFRCWNIFAISWGSRKPLMPVLPTLCNMKRDAIVLGTNCGLPGLISHYFFSLVFSYTQLF